MRIRGVLFSMSLVIAWSGCATLQSYDVPEVQKNFAEAMKKSDDVVGRAQADYREKTVLMENLRKAGAPAFKEHENDLVKRLAAMNAALAKMTQHKKAMSTANSNLVSLAYSHSKVSSAEDGYERVDEAVHEFEAAANQLNTVVAEYSRESNSLADLVTQKKLFFNFDVSEFQKRVQQTVRTAQDNQKNMERELKRAENTVNSASGDGGRAGLRDLYSDMATLASDYNTKAQNLSVISRDMHATTLGSARVSTLDANWPAVQKHLSEFDRLVHDLSETNQKFLNKAEAFRSSR